MRTQPPPQSMPALVSGADAWTCLGDESFRRGWARLWGRCPWATAFQSPEFAAVWYRTYGEQYEPVLVASRDDAGELTGLLTLARPLGGEGLVAAGAHQAEYQVWLCTEDAADDFPGRALDLLRRNFPSSGLRLSYVPARTPLGWLDEPGFRRRAALKPCRRPLLNLGAGDDGDSLSKPGNKSRLRQLKKLGPVEFRRVTDPAEFRPLLDQLILFHDRRQSASHGSTPFRNDPRKEAFHLALLNETGLLHATALKAGDQVVSAHLNMIRRSEVQLFLIAHNPDLERLSPGKLHIRFLERMLAQEGYERLDLTPGGEEYKERFANGADVVHALTLFPSTVSRIVGVGIDTVEDCTKTVLARMHLKPAALASFARGARNDAIADALRRFVEE